MRKTAFDYVRPPAVAGRFYPADPAELRRSVETYLSEASLQDPRPVKSAPPKP